MMKIKNYMNDGADQQAQAMNWIKCTDGLPEDGKAVETKIDDSGGVRNVVKLRRKGRLWFFPDMSMHVYYTPTHWRYV